MHHNKIKEQINEINEQREILKAANFEEIEEENEQLMQGTLFRKKETDLINHLLNLRLYLILKLEDGEVDFQKNKISACELNDKSKKINKINETIFHLISTPETINNKDKSLCSQKLEQIRLLIEEYANSYDVFADSEANTVSTAISVFLKDKNTIKKLALQRLQNYIDIAEGKTSSIFNFFKSWISQHVFATVDKVALQKMIYALNGKDINFTPADVSSLRATVKDVITDLDEAALLPVNYKLQEIKMDSVFKSGLIGRRNLI